MKTILPILLAVTLASCKASAPEATPVPAPEAETVDTQTGQPTFINADDPGFSIIDNCRVANAKKADKELQGQLVEVIRCTEKAVDHTAQILSRKGGLKSFLESAARTSRPFQGECGQVIDKIGKQNEIQLGKMRYTFGELHKEQADSGALTVTYQFCGKGRPETGTATLTYPPR